MLPLPSADHPRLTAALEQLLAEGLIWREEEHDLRAYNALARWRDQAAAQLAANGWELVHAEQIQAFQIIPLHAQSQPPRRLSRNTLLCLLVLRLLYVETPAALTPYPVIALSNLARRGAAFSISLDLAEALPELARLKLIRPAGGAQRALRPTNSDQLIELLPTLELALPNTTIEQLFKEIGD